MHASAVFFHVPSKPSHAHAHKSLRPISDSAVYSLYKHKPLSLSTILPRGSPARGLLTCISHVTYDSLQKNSATPSLLLLHLPGGYTSTLSTCTVRVHHGHCHSHSHCRLQHISSIRSSSYSTHTSSYSTRISSYSTYVLYSTQVSPYRKGSQEIHPLFWQDRSAVCPLLCCTRSTRRR
jgi:hypothetical protein